MFRSMSFPRVIYIIFFWFGIYIGASVDSIRQRTNETLMLAVFFFGWRRRENLRNSVCVNVVHCNLCWRWIGFGCKWRRHELDWRFACMLCVFFFLCVTIFTLKFVDRLTLITFWWAHNSKVVLTKVILWYAVRTRVAV